MSDSKLLFTQRLISPLKQAETQILVSVLESTGLILFLLKFPLASIEFVRELTDDDGNPINGQYDFKLQTIQVGLHRSNNRDYGQIYEKLKFWSISCLALTAQQAVQRTLVHEVGHHIYNFLLKYHLDLFHHTTLMPSSFALGHYGLKNTREYFAESLTAFIFQRTELFIDDSRGYAMIQMVLARLDLDLQEQP